MWLVGYSDEYKSKELKNKLMSLLKNPEQVLVIKNQFAVKIKEKVNINDKTLHFWFFDYDFIGDKKPNYYLTLMENKSAKWKKVAIIKDNDIIYVRGL